MSKERSTRRRGSSVYEEATEETSCSVAVCHLQDLAREATAEEGPGKGVRRMEPPLVMAAP